MLLCALLTFVQSTSVTEVCSSAFSPSGIATGSWQSCLKTVAEARGEPVPLFGRFASPTATWSPAADLVPSRAQVRALVSCAERSLRSDPWLSGRIELELAIDEDGRVRPEVVVDTVGDGSLTLCFVQRARAWRFGRGPARRIRLPIVSRSSDLSP
jgi:hypothetical protein